HMPVHLGSMPMSVKAALENVDLAPGDAVILNDPYCGGTHLPDITIVSPIFLKKTKKPQLYVANRAHHSDVGGMSPGSMPLASEIFQEGLILPPVKLVRGGNIDTEILSLILANVRTPQERKGDLNAQLASNFIGSKRLKEMAKRYNSDRLLGMLSQLQDYSERITRNFIAGLPDGSYGFIDFLDNDGLSNEPIKISVDITINIDSVTIDFTGTSQQVPGSVNAIEAVTLSAALYVFKAIIGGDVLANSGILRPITLIAPKGTVINANHPAPVAGGNVETSQRIVDVLLGALHLVVPDMVPAASAGSMTNISFGGQDEKDSKPFAYYETIAGGHGASKSCDGISGKHSHMTNSLNTPVEALEHSMPIRIEEYRFRSNSGGFGRNIGGNGIIRSFQFLNPAEVTILSERHKIAPYGLLGGKSGSPGVITVNRGTDTKIIPSKTHFSIMKNDILTIKTPGGGGYGTVDN
ncbi:MAG: hydantoinase B/oxoprolinase family protein, partial [Chlorobiales bacterium]|nr:hydantoinase B/oxoprolinase family protein [Chlorobiales bacterium]